VGAALHPLPGKTGTGFALKLLPTISSLAGCLAGLFLPDRCRICEQVLDRITRVPVCDNCWSGLAAQSQASVCRICGISSPPELTEYTCPDCVELPPHFLAARSYAAYGGALRELLHWLKYRGMEPLAIPLGQRVASVADAPECRGILGHCQAVIAVPLESGRKRERGYNQAELLARVVARQLRLPLLPAAALQRTRATPSQSGLHRVERRENMRGAFSAKRSAKHPSLPQGVLLIDDVMTTGATLDACAQALMAAGVREVIALTVARTPSLELS
jgi:ComF family protein